RDWEAKMVKTAPLVFGFVLIFAFLILLASFRSLVVAIKAIVLNLLSVGAAYGILVATFQWGWGESLLDFKSNGGITPWLPMFLFVILFGLSMDYHVFILSRVRELYDRGMSTDDAAGRLDQPEDREPERRLARARLADDGDRLAALDLE
ncbi:MAG: putative drug exporter of the superfamily, partial [Gaiellaceae bacterium]|nr:putative drug exporter of the superfamily [Gaiellaceae bacterium]